MPGIFGNYEDQDCFPGEDFKFAFTAIPLDLTGCSAVMTIKGLNAGADVTFTVTCTTNNVGTTAEGVFTLDVPGMTTESYVPGTYLYYVILTFSDSSTEVLVGGVFTVKEFPVP